MVQSSTFEFAIWAHKFSPILTTLRLHFESQTIAITSHFSTMHHFRMKKWKAWQACCAQLQFQSCDWIVHGTKFRQVNLKCNKKKKKKMCGQCDNKSELGAYPSAGLEWINSVTYSVVSSEDVGVG